jgi:hypothetical protein
MPLPFEKDNNRKWQCFVCGHSHSDFESFKQHIIEKHQEGREFVVCPLARCGAPVRDLKLHFKAKHPHDPLPKSGPMKALIMKDQAPSGKVKTRKPQFREGYVISTKNNGKEMHYRSGLECEIYECLEAIPEVLKYDVEPFKDGIPYLYKGKQHKYYPDLSIQFTDGHVEIWEIKPASQTDLEVNQCKWESATKFCEARGWDFIVITEVGLGKLRKLAKRNIALNEVDK